MKIANTTPVVAGAVVARVRELDSHVILLTAKATYRLDGGGGVAPEVEEPYPLFDQDVETDLGLLPRDDLPRWDDAFEVILLGKAHAPGGRPARRLEAALTVGSVRRELVVFGDRIWEGKGRRRRISEPEPFLEMPLTYERAFGGTREVLIDRDAPVDVADSRNPAGRGFDHELQVKGLVKAFKPPKGYPIYDRTRHLPNVEDPSSLIARPEDTPRPASWATVPMSCGFHVERALHLGEDGLPQEEESMFGPELFHRAHPDWVIELPEPRARVRLEGLTPGGDLSFELPQARVFADVLLGEHGGEVELRPHLLLLLPEEERVVLVFRERIRAPVEDETERSARIRTETGWYGGPGEQGED